MSSGRFRVLVHTNLHSVAYLWSQFEQAGCASGFHSLGWTRRAVESFGGEDKSPLIVEVRDRDSGRPLMLAPLALHRQIGRQRITWLDFGVVDYAAPIVAPDVTVDAEFAADSWEAIQQALPPADLIQIERIPRRLLGRPNPLALLSGCVESQTQSFAVEIGAVEGRVVRAVAKPAVAKELDRRNRRLAEQGAVRFVAAGTSDEVDAIFDELRRQRNARFAALGRYDLLTAGSAAQFYRQAAHDGLRGGCARLFGLALGDLWLATAYGLASPGVFHMVITTMQEGEWRRLSPGLLLIERVMEWSRGQGHATFDFSVGDLAYKSDLGGAPSTLLEWSSAHTARGAAIKLTAEVASASKAWLAAQPQLFGLMKRARQELRRSLLL